MVLETAESILQEEENKIAAGAEEKEPPQPRIAKSLFHHDFLNEKWSRDAS